MMRRSSAIVRTGVAAVAALVFVASAARAPAPALAGDGGESSCTLKGTIVEHYARTSVVTPASSCKPTLVSDDGSLAGVTSEVTVELADDAVKVTFAFAQPTLRSPQSIFHEDTLRATVFENGTTTRPTLEYLVSAYGRCKVASGKLLLLATETCSVTIAEHWNPRTMRWRGTLTIPYAQLARFNVRSDFKIEILREYYVGGDDGQPGRTPRPTEYSASVHFSTTRSAAFIRADRYIAGGPDIANPPPGTPRHRAVGNVFAPLSPQTVVASTFSDDSGPLLSIRDQAVKSSLTEPQAKKLSCRSCGSFFTDDQQAFSQALTSTNVLGVDLSKLGVDRVPFEPAALGFPIDAGYKAANAANAFAFAAFAGTSPNAGVARDAVALYERSFVQDNSALRFSVYHATANRSMPPPPVTTPFPSVLTPVAHTDDTQATVAYSTVSKFVPKEDLISTEPLRNTSVMIRYGTQYGRLAGTLDAAVSRQIDPPLLNLTSKAAEKGRFGWAFGYRNVGPAYLPMDSRFDLFTGLHGWYGLAEYKGAIPFSNQPYDLKMSGYRMSDALQARDVSLNVDVKFPLTARLALVGSFANAALTESQAARANKFLLSDAQRGTAFLPNGQRSASFTYTPDARFSASLGFARIESQGCNKKAQILPPCYSFVGSSGTGSFAWQAFSDIFIDASVKNASSDPFRTGGIEPLPEPSRDFYSTSSSHMEYAYALGANVLKTKAGGCSTLLLTSTNRTSGIDVVANTPNQPRFARTVSLELVPGKLWPTALIAYSRVGFIDTTQPTQTMFIARLQYGVEPRPYSEAVRRKC